MFFTLDDKMHNKVIGIEEENGQWNSLDNRIRYVGMIFVPCVVIECIEILELFTTYKILPPNQEHDNLSSIDLYQSLLSIHRVSSRGM